MERLDKLQIWCGDGIGKNLCLLTGYNDSTIHIASQLTTEMEVYIREFVCKIKFVRKLGNASHQE
jgi:Zn ribbon nucleic-acid-binding protein